MNFCGLFIIKFKLQLYLTNLNLRQTQICPQLKLSFNHKLKSLFRVFCHLHYYIFNQLDRYQIQMEQLNAEESLFNESQLQKIDRVIELNMQSHLQQLIQSRVAMLLESKMVAYQPPPTNQEVSPIELNCCVLVNQLNEFWQSRQQEYLQKLNQQKKAKVSLEAIMIEKEEMNSQLNSSLQSKDQIIIQLSKEKHSLNAILFALKQQLESEKEKYTKQAFGKQEFINEKTVEAQKLMIRIKQCQIQRNTFSEQNQRLKEQWNAMNEQLSHMELWLIEDLASLKLQLITSNIMVTELDESHSERLQQIDKHVSIHNQNVEIAKLLGKICNLAQINIGQMGDRQHFYQTSLNFDSFNMLSQQFLSISSVLQDFSAKLSQIITIHIEDKDQIEVKSKQLLSLQEKFKETQTFLAASQQECKSLHAILNKEKNDHYAALLNFELNKSKLQAHLFQILSQQKRYQHKIANLEHNINEKNGEIESLLSKIQQDQIQKQELNAALKQQQKVSYQLREEMLNIKSNLEIMVKTEGDDDDSSFNIVQQLIEKNNDLNSQLTLKKLEIDLKEDKISHLNRLIQKSHEEREAQSASVEANNQRVHTLEKELLNKIIENKTLSEQFQVLKNQLKQLANRKIQQIPKILKTCSVQTDEMKSQTIQSRIKRQIVKQAIRSQVQKSHSLLTERDENKENSSINKAPIGMTTHEKETYKQKIMTLNEIINFMMNYSKGLQNGELRSASWFISQVEKHGQEYQGRLMDPVYLGPKVKNAKFIEILCKQDDNCNKLVKQFQAIIDFYINRSHKLDSSMKPQSSYFMQEKLNKTINKRRNSHQNSYNF